MTPKEMAETILFNIEFSRALMEDGPAGLVLHTSDFTRFVCEKDGKPVLGNPQDDNVQVMTSKGRAETLQRFLNSQLPADDPNRVFISLRREAYAGYIDQQQDALNTLLVMIELTRMDKLT
jgi:hypothetical protein